MTLTPTPKSLSGTLSNEREANAKGSSWSYLLLWCVVSVLLCSGLAGCTSQIQSRESEFLKNIRVTSSGGRQAQIVRNVLINSMSPYGYNPDARYTLYVSSSAKKRGLNFSSKLDTTRNQWVGKAKFTLTDKSLKKVVMSGVVYSHNSYSEPAGQFASHTVSLNSMRVTLESLGREVYMRILAWGAEQEPAFLTEAL